MSGNLLWNGAEQQEEIIIQSLTHFDKPTGLHGFPIQYAIDMLLGHTDSTPQLGLGNTKFDTPFLNFGTHMHTFDVYFHRRKSLNRD